jgi:hypothetical protein
MKSMEVTLKKLFTVPKTSGIIFLIGFFLFVCRVSAIELSDEIILPASPLSAHDPAVSYGNDRYLVVWQSGKAEKADIYGCLVDKNGKILSATPFIVCGAFECQERPRTAWGKGIWLVVWADLRNDRDYDIYGTRITADGKVLDPEGILIASGEHNQAQPDVAFNGEHFLVVWRSFEAGKYAGRGVRVTVDGKLVDKQPINIGDEKHYNRSVGELRTGTLGDKWVIAWVSRPSSLTSPAGGGGPTGLYISMLAPAGMVTNIQLGTSKDMNQFKPPVTLASNGKDYFLLSWFNSCTGGRSGPASGMPYGAMVVNAEGKITSTVVLGTPKAEIRQPSAVWDGKGWLILDWSGQCRQPGLGIPEHVNRIVAYIISADGKYEQIVEISSGKPNPGYMPSGCGDGAGNTLVVYERHPEKAGECILIGSRLLRR